MGYPRIPLVKPVVHRRKAVFTPVKEIFQEATFMNKKFKRKVKVLKDKVPKENRVDFTYKKRTGSNFRKLC